jgi:hypothetical protein
MGTLHWKPLPCLCNDPFNTWVRCTESHCPAYVMISLAHGYIVVQKGSLQRQDSGFQCNVPMGTLHWKPLPGWEVYPIVPVRKESCSLGCVLKARYAAWKSPSLLLVAIPMTMYPTKTSMPVSIALQRFLGAVLAYSSPFLSYMKSVLIVKKNRDAASP